MTEQQYKVSWALADRFGHAWTRFFGLEDWTETLTPEAIREEVNQELGKGDLAYYRAPVMDADGSIHHITGTNRVEWFVDPEGVVDVFVHRPMQERVLTFIITSAGEVVVVEGYHSHIIEDTLLPRHVWAGNEVIQAVLGGDFRDLHPALEPEMDSASLSAREAAREAASRLRREAGQLVPGVAVGDDEQLTKKIRQVRDRLNKTTDLAVIEAVAVLLRLGY